MEEINHSFDTLKDTWRPKDNENQESFFCQKLNKAIDFTSLEILIDELLDELINDSLLVFPGGLKTVLEIDIERINEIINIIMKSIQRNFLLAFIFK